MNKKKLVTVCLVVAMMATALIGGSLAYFTDTDAKDNTFTVGNVDIQLIEKQRNDNGSALEPFENNKVLMPIVGSAQGAKDKFGLPTAGNYVDKIVTVKNLKSDAYVRVYYAVPKALLDADGNAGKNVLHINDGNKFVAEGNKTGDGQAINPDYTQYMGKETFVCEYTIDNITYNIYYKDYNKVLTKDEETGAAFIIGLYLDKNVDVSYDDNGKEVYTINGTTIDFDFSNGVKIPVYAVGVQAAGFDNAADAVNAAFGVSFNPWAQE